MEKMYMQNPTSRTEDTKSMREFKHDIGYAKCTETGIK